MQVFLPYPNFTQSVRTLHHSHLGNQRNETYIIMKSLFTGKGWPHHPATKMWEGYEWALLHYQKATVEEWARRGYAPDTVFAKTFRLYYAHRGGRRDIRNVVPPWLGDEEIHESHRSTLVTKNYKHYAPQFPDAPENVPIKYWRP
jgi:hypothetical protein